jgi:ribonuclease P protein component
MAAKNSQPESAAKPPPLPALKLDHLTRRADFLAAARDVRRVAGVITLELTHTPQALVQKDRLRIGFTASRKVGNAVARNRAKRRLRAAARESLPLSGRAGHDYVLVARSGILTRDFQALLGDIKAAMAAAHAKLDGRTGGAT